MPALPRIEEICSLCSKPISLRTRARTNVTRFLSQESRCHCIFSEPVAEASPLLVKTVEDRSKARQICKSDEKLKLLVVDSTTSPAGSKAESSRDDLSYIQENLPARYQVVELLGEGGSGAVVKVLDANTGDTPLAIKILRPQFLHDEEALARFKAEGKLAQCLDHPNIAQVFDFGLGPSGAPYIVMEFVEGESLEQILAGCGTLKIERAVPLFAQLADALAYAHSRKVLHRDIKPSNIVVVNYGGVEIVKIVDFGIARRLLPGGSDSQGLTRTGELIGTPEYMAPERILGQPLDERSDMYSLGCVMYRCLSGAAPFKAKNPIRVMVKHVEENPTPLSALRKIHVSADLNYIVMRCLEKDPNYRYWAEALRKDLSDKLSGKQLQRTVKFPGSSQHPFAPGKAANTRGIPVFISKHAPVKQTFSRPSEVIATPLKDNAILRAMSKFFLMYIATYLVAAPLVGKPIAEMVSELRHPTCIVGLRPSAPEVPARQLIYMDPHEIALDAYRDFIKDDYEHAAGQFNKLVTAYRIAEMQEPLADNLVYLAMCQKATGESWKAAKNFNEALSIYKRHRDLYMEEIAISELDSMTIEDVVDIE